MAAIAPKTANDLLHGAETREAALAALEAREGAHEPALAAAAAGALTELMTVDAEEVGHETFRRVALLRARLLSEASADPAPVFGAMLSEGRAAAYWGAEANVVSRTLRKAPDELDRDDALSYACSVAIEPPANVRCLEKNFAAAGFKHPLQWMKLWMTSDPLVSRAQMPSDDVPRRLLELLLTMLRAPETLPPLAIGGAWWAVHCCLTGRPSLGAVALEHGVMELAAQTLRAVGRADDWISISRGQAGIGATVAFAAYDVCKCFGGEEASRPYLASLMSSGLFDEGIAALEAFERSGASGLQDTDVSALSMALSVVRYGCRGPEGERKVRAAASALTYAINNNLDMLPSVGATSSSSAALIACIVFGRDESTETFRFTQEHTDVMLTGWIHMMKGVGHRARQEPNSDTMMVGELCISDQNKTLLLANAEFIPHLLDGAHDRLQMTVLAGPRFHTDGAVHQACCWTHSTRAPRWRRTRSAWCRRCTSPALRSWWLSSPGVPRCSKTRTCWRLCRSWRRVGSRRWLVSSGSRCCSR